MNNRDDYVEKLKAQLDLWNAQLSAWQSAARGATAEAQTELEKQVGIVKSRLDDMMFRMELMKGASADAWQEVARGADDARKAMQDALDKARSHFKNL